MTMEITKSRMLGVRVGTRSLAELVASAETAIRVRRDSFIFACANPHSLVVARHDAEFREALEGTSAVVADGVGCIWGAALAGGRAKRDGLEGIQPHRTARFSAAAMTECIRRMVLIASPSSASAP